MQTFFPLAISIDNTPIQLDVPTAVFRRGIISLVLKDETFLEKISSHENLVEIYSSARRNVTPTDCPGAMTLGIMERGDSPLVTRGHIDEPLFRAPHLALPTTLSQRTRIPGHPGTETIMSKGPNHSTKAAGFARKLDTGDHREREQEFCSSFVSLDKGFLPFLHVFCRIHERVDLVHSFQLSFWQWTHSLLMSARFYHGV